MSEVFGDVFHRKVPRETFEEWTVSSGNVVERLDPGFTDEQDGVRALYPAGFLRGAGSLSKSRAKAW